MQRESDRTQRLKSSEEAGIYLGVSKWTIKNLRFRGELRGIKIGRRLLFDILDLDAYIDRKKNNH